MRRPNSVVTVRTAHPASGLARGLFSRARSRLRGEFIQTGIALR
jgi:hypothetical protein